MSRAVCTRCHYPLSTCVCSTLATIHTRSRIDILQHPSEVNAAKNTARLCALCLPQCTLWVGESPQDFSELQRQLATENRPVVLLYPDETSMTVKQYAGVQSGAVRLLVLDGTWKKTYKLKQLNTWLERFPKLQLTDVEGHYEIRKAPKPGQLSTLEAIHHALQIIEPDPNYQPLLDCFELRKSHFRQRRTASPDGL